MQSLARFAVDSPVKVTMIFVAILLLGWISLTRLPTNLFPDIRAPKVTTTIRTVGMSPREVERRICEPLERQLSTLRGVVGVQSIARADQAVIVAHFTWDTDLDFAFLDVKKVVGDLQRQRGTEIESASVLRYDPNAAPVMTLALAKRAAVGQELDDAPPVDTDMAAMRRIAERTLKPRFERLSGVANVVVTGGDVEEIRIDLDEALLLANNLDVAAVAAALRADNVDGTGGFVTEGARRYLLKTIGQFQSLDEVAEVVVARPGGSPVLLGDIARISWSVREPRSQVFVNGDPAVGLAFYREAEGNTVAVAQAIREEMARILGGEEEANRPQRGPPRPRRAGETRVLPADATLVVAGDQSEFIRAAIAEVRSNAILGGVLAVLVLFAFLRDLRTTLVIAFAIPVSVVATFNLMYFQGLTLNLMTLGGLALGVGMLVDNAIVVLENIFRLRQQGVPALAAARDGARQVAGAIIAATLTTIVVFLPIVFVRDVAGELFKEQALTVAYSLAASLFVALLLIPMAASRFLSKPPRSMRLDLADGSKAPRNAYTLLLRGALRARPLVLLAGAGAVWLAWAMLQTLPQEFLPRTDQRQVELRLALPEGAPIESTAATARHVAGRIDQFRPAVEMSYAVVGVADDAANADTEDPDGPNTARILTTLVDWNDTPSTPVLAAGLAGFRSSDLIEALEPDLAALPDAKAEFRLQQGSIFELLGTTSAPLIVELAGDEVDILTVLANEAALRLRGAPGLLNVRTNILEGSPEVRIRIDRDQMGRMGLEVQGVADTLRRRLDGEVAGAIRREVGDLDLRLRVDYGRESIDMLRNIVLATADGGRVPLGNIAEFEVVRGPREILRMDQERVARVMADFDEGVKLSDAIAASQAALADMRLPTGYTLRYTGEEAQRAESFRSLGFALALSILLVYMVMASIFESFLQPLLIMGTIPLAGVGIVGALLATGQTLNIMALIGVVMLGGIVVNNAIVLLDCVNQVRGAHPGADPRETLVAGCARRLRPVLMTTATTLLGLLPLALGFGQGAELRQAMAIAVLGGLATSTLLTLVVIPVCQSYLDSALAAAARGRAWVRERLERRGEERTPA